MPTTAARLKWIPRAIRCFLNQTYKNAELLIVEDGGEGVRAIVPSHPRIRYVVTSKCHTLGDKRNVACDCAKGDYVAHWDDDDWSAPERLQYQIDALIRADKLVAGFRRIYFWDESKLVAHEYAGTARYVVGTSLLYRKDWWKGHRFTGLNVGEDNIFVAQANTAKVLMVDDTLGLMVASTHGANTSKRTVNDTWRKADKSEIPGDYFRL